MQVAVPIHPPQPPPSDEIFGVRQTDHAGATNSHMSQPAMNAAALAGDERGSMPAGDMPWVNYFCEAAGMPGTVAGYAPAVGARATCALDVQAIRRGHLVAVYRRMHGMSERAGLVPFFPSEAEIFGGLHAFFEPLHAQYSKSWSPIEAFRGDCNHNKKIAITHTAFEAQIKAIKKRAKKEKLIDTGILALVFDWLNEPISSIVSSDPHANAHKGKRSGPTMCEHNRQKSSCKLCRDSVICEHGIQRVRCKVCACACA